MSFDEAEKLIAETEKSIQKMAASSMKAGEYDEAIKLTSLAKSLSLVATSEGTVSSGQPGATRRRKAPVRTVRTRGAPKEGYPRFERDETNLVRVGWHGTRNLEYREKAPKELLGKLVEKSLKASPQGEPFSTGGDFYVIKDKKGKAIPRSKVTLCLAWLREEELLKKEGHGPNSRYSIPDPKGFKQAVEKRWKALPTR